MRCDHFFSQVGNHIFDECIAGLLRARNKTVVMPVHNLQFLQYADHVVYLHPTDGTVRQCRRCPSVHTMARVLSTARSKH